MGASSDFSNVFDNVHSHKKTSPGHLPIIIRGYHNRISIARQSMVHTGT